MLLEAKKAFKLFIRKFDVFSHLPTFRFNDEPQYQTLTGGIISIILICVFFGVFLQIIQGTFAKTIIKSKEAVIQVQDPQYYQVNLQEDFMFTIGIQNVDLNSGTRYFDIFMEERQYNSSGTYSTSFPLYQCNLTDWADQSFLNFFNSLNLSQWYCPKSNSIMRFQGKYSSQVFKFYKISVRKCDHNLDLSRPCIDNATIDSYVQANDAYKFNFYFVSPLLNPQNEQYISYYVNDMNYFLFSPVYGVSANLYISHYQIQTDESLLPYEVTHAEEGGIVQNPIQTFNYDVQLNQYIRLYLRKASNKFSIKRQFQKVDQTLAYIGGLFFAIIGMLMLVSVYNQLCYELQITKNVYQPFRGTPIDSDSFNFITFLGYIIYSSLQKIGIQLPWQKMKLYHYYLETVRKQIDMRLILKKLIHFQKVTQALLSKQQIKTLHMQQPQDLSEAQQVRMDIKLLNQLKKKKYIPQQRRQNFKNDNFQTQQYFSQLKKSQSILQFSFKNNKVYPMMIIIQKQNSQKKQIQKKIDQKIQNKTKQQDKISQNIKNDKQDNNNLTKKQDKTSQNTKIDKQNNNDETKKQIKMSQKTKNNTQNNNNDTKQEINDEYNKQFQADYKQTFEAMKIYMQNLNDDCLKGRMVAKKIMKRISNEIKSIFLDSHAQLIYENEKQMYQSKND